MHVIKIPLMFVFLCGLASLINTAHAEISRTVLENGLTILTEESHANHIVTIQVFLKMGSLYESDEQAGLSNLMQECLIKGTKSRTASQIALDLERLGSRIGASATREYGVVTLICTSETLDESLSVLFDVLMNATFPEDMISAAKQTVVQRITERGDRPLTRAIDLMVDAHYGSHPFHKPSLGYRKTVISFSRDDLVNWYRMFYIPNNMIFSCVGDFDRSVMVKRVKRALGNLKGKDLHIVETPPLPERIEPVEVIEEKEGQAAWFALCYDAPSYHSNEFFTMEVLNGITGGSMDSRLFTELRDKKGLAYQVSSYYAPRMDTGLFFCYMGTSPHQYEMAKSELLKEVNRMCTELVTEEELRLSKTFLKGMHIMSQESNGGRASLYGSYELMGMGTSFIKHYVNNLMKVNREDILTLAKETIIPAYTLGCVIPPGEDDN